MCLKIELSTTQTYFSKVSFKKSAFDFPDVENKIKKQNKYIFRMLA